MQSFSITADISANMQALQLQPNVGTDDSKPGMPVLRSDTPQEQPLQAIRNNDGIESALLIGANDQAGDTKDDQGSTCGASVTLAPTYKSKGEVYPLLILSSFISDDSTDGDDDDDGYYNGYGATTSSRLPGMNLHEDSSAVASEDLPLAESAQSAPPLSDMSADHPQVLHLAMLVFGGCLKLTGKMDHEYMEPLAALLKSPKCNITDLLLTHGQFSDTGIAMLLEALKGNRTVKHIDISNSAISMKSFSLLTAVIRDYETLQTMSIDNLDLGNAAAESLLKEYLAHKGL